MKNTSKIIILGVKNVDDYLQKRLAQGHFGVFEALTPYRGVITERCYLIVGCELTRDRESVGPVFSRFPQERRKCM